MRHPPPPPRRTRETKDNFPKWLYRLDLNKNRGRPAATWKPLTPPTGHTIYPLLLALLYILPETFFLFCFVIVSFFRVSRHAQPSTFFFFSYFGPAGRPRANISLKRGFLRCCWANSNRPFRLAESMDERRRKKKITDPGRQLLFLPRPVVNAAEDKRKEENGRRSTTSRTQKTGKVVKNVTVAQWIVVFHKNGPNCPLYALFRRPFHCITDSLSLPPVSSFRSFMPVIRLWTAPKLFLLLLFSLKMYTSRNTL